jgi:YidC/Oxa1 family membrane protein insertase
MQQQDDNQKNLLLAIVLSVMVLLGWQLFFVNPKIKDEQERRAQQQQQTHEAKSPTAQPSGTAAPTAGSPTAPGAAPSAPAAPSLVPLTREAALRASPRVAIETPGITGSVSLKGARIDDVVLARYREEATPNSPNVVLLSPSASPEPYFVEFGWMAQAGSSVVLPDQSTEWALESGTKLTPTTPITLAWNNGQGQIFRRKISIDADYMFSIEDSVENKSATAIALDHRSVISRHGTPHVAGFWILHEGLIGVAGDKGLQEVTYANMIKGVNEGDRNMKSFDNVTGGWAGITDKYWATALVPDQTKPMDTFFTGYAKTPSGQKESFQVDYLARGVTVAPGASQNVQTKLFAGAKRVNLIENYERTYNIKKFDLMIDWGWFYFITRPLFHLIDWIAHFFGSLGFRGNFGLAILVTTVMVKAAFFPLANKSYESMAKMKKLQPEMEKLRERYKDDRARQQQELMQLYQKEKINPMAGCFPVVLQIPVFFALYKVLFVTIDMRHAPFYGWINDLSAPDPTTIFNLFGLLPFAPPHFLHVGLWPILMGITMWVQMQLNPQQPDPIQQKIFNWMPVMFTFMLASFPVGLVMYWAWSNVLSLVQQYYINKRNGAEIHLWKNLGVEKLATRFGSKKG